MTRTTALACIALAALVSASEARPRLWVSHGAGSYEDGPDACFAACDKGLLVGGGCHIGSDPGDKKPALASFGPSATDEYWHCQWNPVSAPATEYPTYYCTAICARVIGVQ